MSVAACDMVNPTASKRMTMEDTMPALVRAFVEGGQDAAKLLSEFMRHVARVARPYPDAYFVLSQKNDDAVDDLGNRAFSICASVEKGRFPFSGRPPFAAYVEEQFDEGPENGKRQRHWALLEDAPSVTDRHDFLNVINQLTTLKHLILHSSKQKIEKRQAKQKPAP